MTRTALLAPRFVDPEAPPVSRPEENAGCLLIEGERIVALRRNDEGLGPDWERVRRPGTMIAPGFIDVHVHGRFASARPDTLAQAIADDARAMRTQGTTAFLATSLALRPSELEAFVSAAAAATAIDADDRAQCLGLHLEGPWINPDVSGALDPAAIRSFDPAADLALLDRCEGRLRMVTLAPEMPEADRLLDALGARSVVASLGHTRASADAIDGAVARGLRHVTHLFNAMGPLHHREPGVPGHCLADDRLSCDLICDGFHVHPDMLRVAARALGERLVLITDRLDLSGLAPLPGAARGAPLRTADGTIAGSQIGMGQAVTTFTAATGRSLRDAIAAATLAPARLLGIEAERGTLRPGARADLVVLSEEGRVEETWLGGRPRSAVHDDC